jgi:hypothetical protein
MPLFLTLAFAIIQIGHLGAAIALVNYGASSVVKQAVQQNHFDRSQAQSRLEDLLTMGLKSATVERRNEEGAFDDVAPDLSLVACAELPAYPFVGEFLKATKLGSGSAGGCLDETSFVGPVKLKGPAPYRFVIRGEAKARMNYGARG